MWASLGALSVAFVGYLDPFVPALVRNPPTAALMAIAAVWLLIGVNIVGVRTAGWVQVVTTALKILPLLAVGAVGLMAVEPSHFAVPQTDARAVAGGVTAVTTLTLWAFLGLESATVPAGSIHDPDRTIPRATITGTALAAILYIGSTVGVMSLVAPVALGQSTAPFADAARRFAGEWGARGVALGAAISCFGALNGWVLLAGQLPLAVARDGLFPAIFGRVSPRNTPAAGMMVAGVLTTGLVFLNYTRGLVELFTFIILLSTLSTLVPYVFCSLSVFLWRPKSGQPALPLPRGMGMVAALAFLYAIWAIGGAGPDTVYWGFILLLCGLPVYVLVVRTDKG
jgi:APA family basic amino acid/polyamine antiporter